MAHEWKAGDVGRFATVEHSLFMVDDLGGLIHLVGGSVPTISRGYHMNDHHMVGATFLFNMLPVIEKLLEVLDGT